MIYTGLSRTGEIVDVKAHGGGDISEVYGGIGETNPIYYKSRTITGTLPLSYKALGKPLSDYLIEGNTIQSGTPSPESPVDVVGCGVWDETYQSYKLTPTVNGTEYPFYLGQVETTRRIKKLVLTGEENWDAASQGQPPGINNYFRIPQFTTALLGKVFCTHYVSPDINISVNNTVEGCKVQASSTFATILIIRPPEWQTWSVNDFKSYLAAQYAAGTPVIVWYVLAEPETAVVNEPIHKISNYADAITMAQAGVTIPTTAGSNALSVGTTVQPSSMSITGNIKSN